MGAENHSVKPHASCITPLSGSTMHSAPGLTPHPTGSAHLFTLRSVPSENGKVKLPSNGHLAATPERVCGCLPSTRTSLAHEFGRSAAARGKPTLGELGQRQGAQLHERVIKVDTRGAGALPAPPDQQVIKGGAGAVGGGSPAAPKAVGNDVPALETCVSYDVMPQAPEGGTSGLA